MSSTNGVTAADSITLRSGVTLDLHPMGGGHRDAVLSFANQLPEEDMRFLRIDITQPAVVDEWLANIERGLTLSVVALEGDAVAGYASVHQNPTTWARHLGEIRVNVSGAMRGKGLGRVLTSRAFDMAREKGLQKLTARMTSDQASAQAVFARLGFVAEALLADYVMDKDGVTHDMVIMSYDVGGHSDTVAEPLTL